MRNQYKSSTVIPPADIILDLLNGKDAREPVLDFYSKYITSASTVSVCDADRIYIKTCLNSELQQEIRIDLTKSLPALRKKLIRHLNGADPFVVIIR